MNKQIEIITQAVKAADEIKSNITILNKCFWALDASREVSIKYDKDIQTLMFSVIKIKEKADNIVNNKIFINVAHADYNPAYFFKDEYEAARLVLDLYEDIRSLYDCSKSVLEKQDAPNN